MEQRTNFDFLDGGFSMWDDMEIARWVGQVEGPGILFVKTYEHGERLSKLCGCPFVTGKDSISSRQRFVQELKDKNLPWVVATAAMATGVDIPPLHYVALAGVDAAPIGVVQAAGRATRLDGTNEFEIRVFSPGTATDRADRIVANLDRAGYQVEMPMTLPMREEPEPEGYEQSPRWFWDRTKPAFIQGFWITITIGALLTLTGNC